MYSVTAEYHGQSRWEGIAMRDFSVHLTHRPGELARVTNALSLVGVNLKSVAAMTFGTEALLRFVPDDVDGARQSLRENNIRFEESEVVPILLENQAGELTGVAAKLAEEGLNLHALYVLGVSDDLIELAIAVDDVKKAKRILE
jgi:hypothetical protein